MYIIAVVCINRETGVCSKCATNTHIIDTCRSTIKCCTILLIKYTDYILKLRNSLRNFKTTLIQPVLTNNRAFVAVIPTAILTEESKCIVTTLVILHSLVICRVSLQECIIIWCILLNIISQIPDDLVINILCCIIHYITLHYIWKTKRICHQCVCKCVCIRTCGRETPINIYTKMLSQTSMERRLRCILKFFMRHNTFLCIPGNALNICLKRISDAACLLFCCCRHSEH